MRPGPSGRLTRRVRWLSVVSMACIVAWAVPALVMLDKGFAVQDEGTYVLSYRFWDSNPYFVSGSQYFYGPIFEALGESIPLVRLLRLTMVIGANAWFGWTFLVWLSHERYEALPSSRTSLVLLLTAAGGMSYLWTPLTPGYYDLTADASLVLVSLLLLTLVHAPRVPSWIPLAMGPAAVVLLVTKWTAVTVLVLVLGVAAWALLRHARRAAVRYAALVAVGAASALVVCQLFLVPLGRFVTIMREVSQLTTVGSHSFTYLATHNVGSTASLLLAAAVIGLPLLVGLIVARDMTRRGREPAALRWLLGSAVLTALILPFVVGWHGGSEHGRAVVGVALAGLLVAVMAALMSRPWPLPGERAGGLLAVVLLLVPPLQAAGTNVPLLYVAVECLAMWVALVLMMVTREDCPQVMSIAVLTDLAVLVVATAMIAGSSTLMTPFKTTGVDDDTAQVAALGVRLSPETARQYAALQTALAPYLVPGRTPMITLDQKAGLTYLLHGVPAGSTWTDVASPTRTAGILELACRNGDVSSTRRPILILDRPVDRYVARAMEACGLGYPTDYRRLEVPGGPPDLSVFVPGS